MAHKEDEAEHRRLMLEAEFEAERCECCGSEDEAGNLICEGCGCCNCSCNCTETDCDCEACQERRTDA